VIKNSGILQDEPREFMKYLSLDIMQSRQYSKSVLSHLPHVMNIQEIDYENWNELDCWHVSYVR